MSLYLLCPHIQFRLQRILCYLMHPLWTIIISISVSDVLGNDAVLCYTGVSVFQRSWSSWKQNNPPPETSTNNCENLNNSISMLLDTKWHYVVLNDVGYATMVMNDRWSRWGKKQLRSVLIITPVFARMDRQKLRKFSLHWSPSRDSNQVPYNSSKMLCLSVIRTVYNTTRMLVSLRIYLYRRDLLEKIA